MSSLGEIGKHDRLKICSLVVIGSSPIVSIIGINIKKEEKQRKKGEQFQWQNNGFQNQRLRVQIPFLLFIVVINFAKRKWCIFLKFSEKKDYLFFLFFPLLFPCASRKIILVLLTRDSYCLPYGFLALRKRLSLRKERD